MTPPQRFLYCLMVDSCLSPLYKLGKIENEFFSVQNHFDVNSFISSGNIFRGRWRGLSVNHEKFPLMILNFSSFSFSEFS